MQAELARKRRPLAIARTSPRASSSISPMAQRAGALDDALARAGDGALIIGGDGRIILWNRAAEQILGYSARDVIGRPCCEVLVGADEAGNRLCYQGCHVMTLLRMGETIQSFDMRARNKNGRPVWINVSVLSTSGDRRTGSLTVHLFRDVTATKELLTLVHDKLSGARPGPTAEAEKMLTRRELEVLRLVMQGLSTAKLAEQLHVSSATVRNHVQNIFGKLEVHSRLEAVVYATQHRLL